MANNQVSLYADAVNGDVLLLKAPDEINHASGLGPGTFNVEIVDLRVVEQTYSGSTIEGAYIELRVWVCTTSGSECCGDISGPSLLEED